MLSLILVSAASHDLTGRWIGYMNDNKNVNISFRADISKIGKYQQILIKMGKNHPMLPPKLNILEETGNRSYTIMNPALEEPEILKFLFHPNNGIEAVRAATQSENIEWDVTIEMTPNKSSLITLQKIGKEDWCKYIIKKNDFHLNELFPPYLVTVFILVLCIWLFFTILTYVLSSAKPKTE